MKRRPIEELMRLWIPASAGKQNCGQAGRITTLQPGRGSPASFVVRPIGRAPTAQAWSALLEWFDAEVPGSFVQGNDNRVWADPGLTLSQWTAGLAECGDPKCACNRVSRPHVRRQFAKAAAAELRRTLDRLGGAGLRLVSLGAGRLLTELEVLCRAGAGGVGVEAVMLVDTEYQQPGAPEVERALGQLARFVAPGTVAAFGSVKQLLEASANWPDRYGAVNGLMYCDAAAVPYSDYVAVAAQCLVPAGLSFTLSNTGSPQTAATKPVKWLPLELSLPKGMIEVPEGPRTQLFRQSESSELLPLGIAGGSHSRQDILDWLAGTALERAAAHHRRAFRVEADGRQPVRCRPSVEAGTVGCRRQGDVLIAQRVAAMRCGGELAAGGGRVGAAEPA